MAGAARANSSYLPIYLAFNDAEQFKKSGDYLSAVAELQTAVDLLKIIQFADPRWETALIRSKLKVGEQELTKLKPLAAKQAREEAQGAGSSDVLLAGLYQVAEQSDWKRDRFGTIRKFQRYLAAAEGLPKASSAQKAPDIQVARNEITQLEMRGVEFYGSTGEENHL